MDDRGRKTIAEDEGIYMSVCEGGDPASRCLSLIVLRQDVLLILETSEHGQRETAETDSSRIYLHRSNRDESDPN